MLELASNLLAKNQNDDGGWGAVAGRRSHTEVTALALLASRSLSADPATVPRATHWLLTRQRADGSWPINDTAKDPSWSTAVAALALAEFPDGRESVSRAANWLLEQEGGKPGLLADLVVFVTGQKRVVRLNRDLIGWPWTTGNFSWVEPTSYGLLALKKLKQRLRADRAEERIAQAELMIYDRMCDGGGWNYGNSEVYGEKLWPYPDITALALIATQDRAARQENRVSLALLKDLVLKANSGLALAWAILCFQLYKQDAGALKEALTQRFVQTQFLGETKALALAMLAMRDGERYFRI